jgi:hypothetical protein
VGPSHAEALRALSRDRRLAHAVLFKHRHPYETPEFHGTLIDDFHDREPQRVIEAFRHGGKSTIGEEATIIKAEFQEFNNGVIVSATQARAAERLAAIKHELENNDLLINTFGAQRSDPWQAHKVVLANGTCLQALGVGQAVRGIKYLEHRPDWIWLDDIEDEESTQTPDACAARLKWLYGTLMPVCAKHARIRVTGNRLSPYAVVSRIAENAAWKSRRFPICHLDLETGREQATWPEYRDMDWIAEKRAELESLGMSQVWASEYMCEAVSESLRPFKEEDIRIFPRIRTFEAVYAMWDPAKTNKNLRQQSHTGKAVFSWIGRKLVVWDAWAKPILPSELIQDVFQTEDQYSPVAMRIEADGLEEWLNEPLRIEQTRRRVLLPHLGPERAPRDKDGFIRALQPFFQSGEIEFAKEIPELRNQVVSFPNGRKDCINALAYALKLRPGQPVYENFSHDNIVEDLPITNRARRFLCLNADGNYVTAVLAQYDGALSILADWIEAGDPGQVIEDLMRRASLAAMGKMDIIVTPRESDKYDAKGIVPALRRQMRYAQGGADPARGRAEIRELLMRKTQLPLVQVSPTASWTLRALSGGYCKAVDRRTGLIGEAEDGAYKTLMEGLESFAGIMHHAADEDGLGDGAGLWRTGRDGRQYRSLIGDRK